ncbi:hypothetical protein ACFPYI_00105 [Halomarina salina]|uniref:Cadherin domain-containing protein n=1 Tax=Halomarina salina TaxID=1872699 RepID=A0ABD5RH78_9EURY|nr:hypothetical protein [Halomarina salina]
MGLSGQRLATITNGFHSRATLRVTFDDEAQGYVENTPLEVEPGEVVEIQCSVDDAATSGTVSFTISLATIDQSTRAELQRSVPVSESSPEFWWTIVDRTKNSVAKYTIQYDARGLAGFDSLDIEFVNQELDYDSANPTLPSSPTTDERGSLTLRDGIGGAENTEYAITIRAYDASGAVIFAETRMDVAGVDDSGGSSPPALNAGTIDSVTVRDELEHNSGWLYIDYDVSETNDHYQYVEVEYENLTNDWASKVSTKQSESGTIDVDLGGQEGNDVVITVRVIDTTGLTADSVRLEHTIGQADVLAWP